MRTAFIFLLILIFLSPGPGFALPIESVSAPSVNSGDAISPGVAPGPPMPKIPRFPVEMFIRKGPNSHFELFFLNVKYGYDLVDFEFYDAWCLREGVPLPGHAIHTVRLYNSYDPDLPPEFKSMAFHRINYLINHKEGSKEDIQEAIWHLAGDRKPGRFGAEALRLVKEADLKGRDYKPAEGDLVAIVSEPAANEQPVFMEYKIPDSVPPVVAPASFIPPLPPLPVSFALPFWVPLVPLVALVSPSSPTPTPPPPPPPPPVPESSTLILLACGMAGILILRKVGKRMKRLVRGGK